MSRRVVGCLVVLLGVVLVTACEREPEAPSPDPTSERSLSGGQVVGFLGDHGSHVWLGLPYAAPPVHERRWRAPRPSTGWSGVRSALETGHPCPQLASSLGGIEDVDPGEPAGHEDCLYLNVYAPARRPDQVPTDDDRWPVMVWLHGGGNVVGHGGLYDGGRLAAQHDVMVVTLNHRLGPLGWFRHPGLRTGATPAEASGNFALLDQIRALRWIRDNIDAFGGDPGNVTVFGESAGGRNILALLLAPAAEGLFHRAIVQSGGLVTATPAQAEHFADAEDPGHRHSSNEILARLLIEEGHVSDRAGAKRWIGEAAPETVAAFLRGLPPSTLLFAYAPERPGAFSEVPQIFADGEVLPEGDPLEHLATPGGYNAVPVMIGSNREEMKLFMAVDPVWVREILWTVPRLREPALYAVAAEYASRLWKATGVDLPAAALAANPGQSVYAYRFDYDEWPVMLGTDLSKMLGAAHAFEIPFVFGDWHLTEEADDLLFVEANRPGREALSAQIRRYWTGFARAGDPRAEGLPRWRPWTVDRSRYLVLDTVAGGGLRMEDRTWRPSDLIAMVERDERLKTDRERCAVYRVMADFGRGFTRGDYDRADCVEFPFEAFPWRDR